MTDTKETLAKLKRSDLIDRLLACQKEIGELTAETEELHSARLEVRERLKMAQERLDEVRAQCAEIAADRDGRAQSALSGDNQGHPPGIHGVEYWERPMTEQTYVWRDEAWHRAGDGAVGIISDRGGSFPSKSPDGRPTNSIGKLYLLINRFTWNTLDPAAQAKYRAVSPMGRWRGRLRYELLAPGGDGEVFKYPDIATDDDTGAGQRAEPAGGPGAVDNRKAPGG